MRKLALLLASLAFLAPVADAAVNYGTLIPVASQMTGYWQMDGNKNDTSGNATTQLSNSTTTYGLAYGRFGQGADFWPNATYIRSTTTAYKSINTNVAWTARLWIYLTTTTPGTGSIAPAEEAIFSIGTTGAGEFSFDTELLASTTGSRWQLKHTKRAVTNNSAVSNTTFTSGQWYQVVTVGNADDTYTLFINGAQDVTLGNAVSGDVASTGGICLNIDIACTTDTPGAGSYGGYVNGDFYIDDFLFVNNTAWTARQVAKDYQQGKGRIAPKPK